MNRITPKDERLSIEQLSDQLYDYIKQFIIDPEEWTEMMKQILAMLKNDGFKRVSLSVQKANYAVKMYQTLGFQVIVDNPDEYIMIIDL